MALSSSYTVLTGTSVTGAFTNLSAGNRVITTDKTKTFHVTQSASSVVLDTFLTPATIGTITAAPTSVIAGGSVAVGFTVQNSAAGGSDTLNFTATPISSTLTGSAGGTLGANSTSGSIAGLTSSSTTPASGQTATFTVADPNSTNGSAIGTVSVNVLDHSSPSLGSSTVTLPAIVHVGDTIAGRARHSTMPRTPVCAAGGTANHEPDQRPERFGLRPDRPRCRPDPQHRGGQHSATPGSGHAYSQTYTIGTADDQTYAGKGEVSNADLTFTVNATVNDYAKPVYSNGGGAAAYTRRQSYHLHAGLRHPDAIRRQRQQQL